MNRGGNAVNLPSELLRSEGSFFIPKHVLNLPFKNIARKEGNKHVS